MRRLALFTTALLTGLAPSEACRAQGDSRPGLGEQQFLSRLRSCPVSVRDRLAAPDLSDEVEYWREGSWMGRTSWSFGHGINGVTSAVHQLVHFPSCFETSVREALENSSLFERWLYFGAEAAPSPPNITSLVLREPVEVYDPEDPRHSLSGLLREARHRSGMDETPELGDCEPAPEPDSEVRSSPVLAPSQRWYPGRPSAAPTVQHDRYLTRATASPQQVWSEGSTEVYEVDLPSRYRARAVAVYDASGDLHRWALVTRWCVVGSIEWLGRREHWLLGVAGDPSSTNAPRLFAVDLRRGSARALRFRSLENDDGLPTVYDLCSATTDADVTCLRPRITRSSLILEICQTWNHSCRRHSYRLRRILHL